FYRTDLEYDEHSEVEESTWTIFRRLPFLLKSYDKTKEHLLTYLCRCAEKDFFNRVADAGFDVSKVTLNEQIHSKEPQHLDEYGFETAGQSPESKLEHNLKVLKRYLMKNYTPLERRVILHYYSYWDPKLKQVHIPKED